jgi:DHA2 family multidrug resistance protein-like MFS transporter
MHPMRLPPHVDPAILRSMTSDTELSPRERALASLAIFATLVLVVVDGAIANLALPSLTRAFPITPSQSIWVVTAYQMALVMFLLPAAALGEGRGLRRIFILGVALFTAASGLCAVSPSLAWLVAARFLQGFGSAAVMALGVGLLRHVYPPRLLGRGLGTNALVIALSAAAGPAIGAAILSVADWPWLFAVNLPVGAFVLLTARHLPNPPGTGRRPDLASIALNAGLFGPLVLGVDRLSTAPGQGLALIAVALACLLLLLRRELPRPAPLIPLDLLRLPPFGLGVLASVCCFTGQMAATVALPFYLQHGWGRSAAETGLYMIPWPLAVAVAAPLSGRLSDKVPTGWLCAAGGTCLAAGLLMAALTPRAAGLAPLVAATLLCGLGFGFFQTPNNRTMLLAAPRERSGAAGGMQGTARLSGQTAGALVMTLLFALTPMEAAPRLGLAIAAVFALAGGLVSLARAWSFSPSSPAP